MTEHILSWIVFLPLIGMTAILFVPKTNVGGLKLVSLIATGIPLVLATWVYFGLFDKSEAGLQLVERVPWITAIGVEYAQHGDNLDGRSISLGGTDITALTGVLSSLGLGVGDTLRQLPEDDWIDVFFAHALNKNLSITVAAAMLGNITLTPDQTGFYLSMHATF